MLISCFGHNTQSLAWALSEMITSCRGKASFTLGYVVVTLPGGSQPHVRTPGISNHRLWKKGSWANISCNLLAKSEPLATGSRQEHSLQHVPACCPVDYLGPSSKSENVCNKNLQECPGFVPRCNLRWDTDLHILSLSHLLSSLSACYFWE